MKHTKGPWIADGYNIWSSAKTTGGIGVRLAVIQECTSKPGLNFRSAVTRKKAIANARLIAAAPELLEALKDMVSEMYEQGLVDVLDEKSITFKVLTKRIRKAEKAIAKARGEE